MDNSRTLLIGLPATPHFSSAPLFSDINLYEYSFIIWDIASLTEELTSSNVKFDGTPVDEDMKNIVEKHVNARVGQLIQWVKAGHCLIVIARQPISLFWHDMYDRYAYYRLDARLVVRELELRATTGTRVEYVGPKAAEAYFIVCDDCFEYEVLLEGGAISPLLVASRASKGPNQVVAGFKRVGNGAVVLVPPAPKVQPPSALYENWAGLGQTLMPERRADLPSWVPQYQFEFERAAREQMEECQIEISRLEGVIEQQEAVVAEANNLKTLFAGTGDAFVGAVQRALLELGLNVVEGPHPRADLLAFDTDGKRVLAVEAKGLDGSSKEADLRQVEGWLAEVRKCLVADEELLADDPYLRRYEAQLQELGVPFDIDPPVPVHGLLVIGTYRQTPLQERQALGFPEPLASVIRRTDVCAITGLQLLRLVLICRDQPAKKAEIVDTLFGTNGVLAEDLDWRQFLSSPDPGGQNEAEAS